MPSASIPPRQAILKSLQTKLLAYSEYLLSRSPGSARAQRFADEANSLFAQGSLTSLARWAKEVDVLIRETLEPNRQEDVAQIMKQAGVLQEHLPKIWSVGAAQRILKRNTIRNEVDFSVVRVTLDSEGHGHLTHEELVRLGKLFDEYSVAAKIGAS